MMTGTSGRISFILGSISRPVTPGIAGAGLEMVVVTARISKPRSRAEREALRDAPPEAESR